MHIVEGFLPFEWCIIWFVLSIIAIVIGIVQLRRLGSDVPETKRFLAINAVVMFVASLFKLPAVEGCPANVPFNTLSGSFLGPAITSVIVAIVLLLQAFLLGYGGLTTLGANIFSMGVVGPLAACIVYHFANKANISNIISIILAVIFANLFTILTAAIQFGLVYGRILMFFVILLINQIPLVVLDIIITVIVYFAVTKLFGDSKIFSLDFNEFFSVK